MDLKTALDELAKDIKEQVLANLRGKDGVNAKTGTNTLIGSKLEKSIDTKVMGDNMIVFQIADYYTYVVGGRRKGWGSAPPVGFVEGVTRWVREKGIRFNGKTETQTIWACIHSIVKKGIRPRPFIGNGYINDDPSYVLPFLDSFFEEWADDVFEEIVKMLDTHFN